MCSRTCVTTHLVLTCPEGYQTETWATINFANKSNEVRVRERINFELPPAERMYQNYTVAAVLDLHLPEATSEVTTLDDLVLLVLIIDPVVAISISG